MQRGYGKITPRFWTGATGRALRREDQWVRTVATYLMTSPHASMIGLYYLTLPSLAYEVGCPMKTAVGALATLKNLGFCRYDRAEDLVWVINMAREQLGSSLQEGDKRTTHIRRLLRPYMHTPLAFQWLQRYARAFHCQDLLQEAARFHGQARQREEAEHSPALGRGQDARSRAGAGGVRDDLAALELELELEQLGRDDDDEQLVALEEAAHSPAELALGPGQDARPHAGAGAVRDDLVELEHEQLSRDDDDDDEQLAALEEAEHSPAELELALGPGQNARPHAGAGGDDLAELELDDEDTRTRAGAGARDARARANIDLAAAKALQLLSEVAGRRFAMSGEVRGAIAAILDAGYTSSDIEAVVCAKGREWRGVAKMAKQLKPSVLFTLRNFRKYMDEDVRPGPAAGGAFTSAAEAWQLVAKEIHRVGRYGRPSLPEPLASAVKKVGWANLAMARSEDAPRMFARAFREVVGA